MTKRLANDVQRCTGNKIVNKGGKEGVLLCNQRHWCERYLQKGDGITPLGEGNGDGFNFNCTIFIDIHQ